MEALHFKSMPALLQTGLRSMMTATSGLIPLLHADLEGLPLSALPLDR